MNGLKDINFEVRGFIFGIIVLCLAYVLSLIHICKVAMDIVAKHIEPDQNGVRIAELTEISYRCV